VTTHAYEYEGSELQLFTNAVQWKAYWASRVRSFVHGRVMEVGAGIGSNIPYYMNDRVTELLAVEPDERLCESLMAKLIAAYPHRLVGSLHGTLSDVEQESRWNSILYIDVIEHIENDQDELSRAATYLSPGGFLCVLVPAHQHLYSPFDKSVGHFRRYNCSMLRAVTPPGCSLRSLRYLDSVGYLASLANKTILKQSIPTESQILFWDRVLVTASRVVDVVTANRIGKSLLAVWRKDA
jgi:hypothetical protein